MQKPVSKTILVKRLRKQHRKHAGQYEGADRGLDAADMIERATS